MERDSQGALSGSAVGVQSHYRKAWKESECETAAFSALASILHLVYAADMFSLEAPHECIVWQNLPADSVR